MYSYFWDDALPWIIGVICIGLGALFAWAEIEDGKQWSAFKDAHHCKVVAHITGDTLVTPVVTGGNGGVGVGITSTPDKTGWLCDDGVTYYR